MRDQRRTGGKGRDFRLVGGEKPCLTFSHGLRYSDIPDINEVNIQS
jgi:hypothetical protein